MTVDNGFENLVIYLSAWQVIKKIEEKGSVSKEILERINEKNAELMGVEILPL